MRWVIPTILVSLAIIILASLAATVSVTRVNSQTKSGDLTYIYFETVSGPSSSTPSPNTAMTPPSGSGNYTINGGSSGYLWSPQFTSSTTINAGSWIIDIWAQSTKGIRI